MKVVPILKFAMIGIHASLKAGLVIKTAVLNDTQLFMAPMHRAELILSRLQFSCTVTNSTTGMPYVNPINDNSIADLYKT